jgi:hypothetical protein
MNDWTPTHRITITRNDNDPEIVDVMLIDGAAYTAVEWDAEVAADWERDVNGNWSFQGRSAPCAGCSVSVAALAEITIATITRADVAALRDDAQQCGDEALARIAHKALVSIDTAPRDVQYPDTESLRECVRVIRRSRED